MSKIDRSSLVPGELVRLRLELRYVRGDGGHQKFEVRDESGRRTEFWLAKDVAASFERIGPPEWPPQSGDLWANPQGIRFFAVMTGVGRMELVDTDGRRATADFILMSYGPLHLVDRPGPFAGDGASTSDAAPALDPTPTVAASGGETVEDTAATDGEVPGRMSMLTPSGDLIAVPWGLNDAGRHGSASDSALLAGRDG